MSERTKRGTNPLLELIEQHGTLLRVTVPTVIAATTVATGILFGPPSAVLVLAGCALLSVIALFWSSVRTLVGETPLSGADAYALGAPKQEQERKQAMLRALKDLEYERSVGKISEEDFLVLNRRYREEAKRLLRFLADDAAPRRKRAEALLERRLQSLASDEKTDEAPARPSKKQLDRVACDACGAKNERDATFCKKCGERLGSGSAEPPRKKRRKTSQRRKASA